MLLHDKGSQTFGHHASLLLSIADHDNEALDVKLEGEFAFGYRTRTRLRIHLCQDEFHVFVVRVVLFCDPCLDFVAFEFFLAFEELRAGAVFSDYVLLCVYVWALLYVFIVTLCRELIYTRRMKFRIPKVFTLNTPSVSEI